MARLFLKVPLWEKCSRKEVELSDESFLCNAKPKAVRQGAVYKNSLRTRLNLPTSGSCLVRREGQARGSETAPVASSGDRQNRSNAEACCAIFSRGKLNACGLVGLEWTSSRYRLPIGRVTTDETMKSLDFLPIIVPMNESAELREKITQILDAHRSGHWDKLRAVEMEFKSPVISASVADAS